MNRINDSEIIIATKNQGKFIEIKNLLKKINLKAISLNELIDVPPLIEDGQTFKENALYKARTISKMFDVGVLADDSGLEVEFLDGLPGVKSARFAGENADDMKNNQKLISLLEDIPLDDRRARFKCVIALVYNSGEYTTEGICDGYIALEPKGNKGFGYDPLFWVPEYNMTFGEMGPNIKNSISHRAIALSKMVEILDLLVNTR